MPHLATYVHLVDRAEQTLADSFRTVGEAQVKHPDIYFTCHTLASMSDRHREMLMPVTGRYCEDADASASETDRLHAEGLVEVRTGAVGLLRDLQDLHLLATLVQTSWTVIRQGAQGLRDHELLRVTDEASADTARQIAWLTTRMKAVAPQALIVA